MMSGKIDYKIVEDIEQLEGTVQLQHIIWGESNICPTALLIPAIRNGGVVIGAYCGHQLAGFCFGFGGYKSGTPYLYSHLLGIHPDYRDQGVGLQLKLHQREWAINYGYAKMVWTFDPLESRNAYFNLCKLGGTVNRYYSSYYGQMKDKLNSGLPSDRFLLEWELGSVRTAQILKDGSGHSERWAAYPVLLDGVQYGNHPHPVPMQRTGDEPGYLLAVPRSVQEMKRDDFAAAEMWRYALREQFTEAFAKGYRVTGLLRSEGPVHYYAVESCRSHGKGEEDD